MSTGQNASAGKGRVLLWVGLVVVLALVAAALTWMVSSTSYSPGERLVSPRLQVAGGSDHVDEEAALRIRVPAGWQVAEGMPYGSTGLEREADDAADDGAGAETAEAGPGGFVMVGRLTDEYAPASEMDSREAAAFIMEVMGQQFLTFPGEVTLTEQRVEEVSARAGNGWAVSLRVIPVLPEGMAPPEDPTVLQGGVAYSAVVGEGDDRWWLTYIGAPADGSMDSPGVEWAEEIVERLEPTGEAPLADKPAEQGQGGPTI